MRAYAGDTIRDGDGGQAAATPERIRAYAGDTVRDGDGGQAAATFERFIAYSGDRFSLVGSRDYQFAAGRCIAIRHIVAFAITI